MPKVEIIKRMTQENAVISYSIGKSPFGDVLIASTDQGICYLAFISDEVAGFADLQSRFPKTSFIKEYTEIHDLNSLENVSLHLKGTDFQLKVWNALLDIPRGKLTTYGDIANKIDNPKAVRAVGTAIGDNPVAFIIPCHRVVRSSGGLGGYHWGLDRKRAMIDWEAGVNELNEKKRDNIF